MDGRVCSPHLCPARANRTGAPEGTHTRTRETATRVLAALATKLGRDTDDWNNPLRIGRGYYSD